MDLSLVILALVWSLHATGLKEQQCETFHSLLRLHSLLFIKEYRIQYHIYLKDT